MRLVKTISLCSLGATFFLPTFSFAADTDTTDSSIEGALSAPVVWFGAQDNSSYGALAHSQFANLLSPYDAAAFLLDYGPNQFRIGLTWGHALDDHQRFKLSAEHLAQSNDFDFVTGTDHIYNGQNAFGASYQYLTSKRFLKGYTFSGYYANASNGDFSSQNFSTNEGEFIDVRNVVGATSAGFAVGPQLKFWDSGMFTLALSYDNVHYSPQNEPAKNSSGFGQTITFVQRLSKNTALNLMVSNRQPFQVYQAGIDWLARQKETSSLTLGLQGSHLQSDSLPVSSQNIVGLNLAFSWGGSPAARMPNPQTTGGPADLIDWTAQSAAYLPGVFVMKDEAVTPAN